MASKESDNDKNGKAGDKAQEIPHLMTMQTIFLLEAVAPINLGAMP